MSFRYLVSRLFVYLYKFFLFVFSHTHTCAPFFLYICVFIFLSLTKNSRFFLVAKFFYFFLHYLSLLILKLFSKNYSNPFVFFFLSLLSLRSKWISVVLSNQVYIDNPPITLLVNTIWKLGECFCNINICCRSYHNSSYQRQE